jgi:hypothetical protein
MSIDADLRRLDHILSRLTGDKALRDEAKAIVNRMIDAPAPTAAWWDRHGPPPDREWKPGVAVLPPRSLRLWDCIIDRGPSSVREVSLFLGIDEAYARRLVSRADTEMLNRGGNATIAIDAGMIRTAIRTIVVSQTTARND